MKLNNEFMVSQAKKHHKQLNLHDFWMNTKEINGGSVMNTTAF